jgi:hypothetical protein
VSDDAAKQISTEDHDEEPEIKPYRLQMNFTGAHADPQVLSDIYDAVVENAIKRGLFFDFGNIADMDREDVVPGTDLEKVLIGAPRTDTLE